MDSKILNSNLGSFRFSLGKLLNKKVPSYGKCTDLVSLTFLLLECLIIIIKICSLRSYDPPLKRLSTFITNPKVTNNGITNKHNQRRFKGNNKFVRKLRQFEKSGVKLQRSTKERRTTFGEVQKFKSSRNQDSIVFLYPLKIVIL